MDQFYTKDEVALNLYNKFKSVINVGDYDIVLEPSAGKGAFFKLLPKDKRVGIDLDPKYEEVLKMDFFNYIPEIDKKYITIGNPPFGRVSSTAIKFFNRAAEFSDVIAFIIPRTFNRISVKNKLSLDFRLVYNIELPNVPCCFEPKMNAKCCFQIWKRTDIKRNLVDVKLTHNDFCFVKYGGKNQEGIPSCPLKEDYDIIMKAFGSSCGKIVDLHVNLKAKSHHFIKSNIPIEELKNNFKKIDYSISKETCRQDSIGKGDLIMLYSEIFG